MKIKSNHSTNNYIKSAQIKFNQINSTKILSAILNLSVFLPQEPPKRVLTTTRTKD